MAQKIYSIEDLSPMPPCELTGRKTSPSRLDELEANPPEPTTGYVGFTPLQVCPERFNVLGLDKPGRDALDGLVQAMNDVAEDYDRLKEYLPVDSLAAIKASYGDVIIGLGRIVLEGQPVGYFLDQIEDGLNNLKGAQAQLACGLSDRQSKTPEISDAMLDMSDALARAHEGLQGLDDWLQRDYAD